MIPVIQYRPFQKWIVIATLLCLPIFDYAQSDFQQDSVVHGYEGEEDTTYTEEESKVDSVTFRATPDSVIRQLQQQKEFAYANDPEYWKKDKPAPRRRPGWGSLFLSAAFRFVFLGVFIVVLIYILGRVLAENKIILFKRKKRWIDPNNIDEISSESNLSQLIAAAEAEGQYRLASRYRYMQLLQEMDSRQLIRTHAELTNWDYVRQMGAHPLNAKFKWLTQAYEYVWYGEFNLNSEQYALLRKKFETFLQ